MIKINLLKIPTTLFIFYLYPLQNQKILKNITKKTNNLYKY